jgi:hypothetical protein
MLNMIDIIATEEYTRGLSWNGQFNKQLLFTRRKLDENAIEVAQRFDTHSTSRGRWYDDQPLSTTKR